VRPAWLMRGSRQWPRSFRLAGEYLPGAHHPHCDRYNHHLIWVGQRPLCLGCTSIAAGVVLGLISLILVPWTKATTALWMIGHLALVAPTALQPLFQRKSFKIFARGLLGAATASYWISGAVLLAPPLPRWLWVASMFGAFMFGYKLLTSLRAARRNDPCAACPEGIYPTCNWNLPRLLTQGNYDIELNTLRSNVSIGGQAPSSSASATLLTRRRRRGPLRSAPAGHEGLPRITRQVRPWN
jgi:hypothetical protein